MKEQARNLRIISVRVTVVEVLTGDQLRVDSFDRQGGRKDTEAETKPSTTWDSSSESFLRPQLGTTSKQFNSRAQLGIKRSVNPID